VVQKQHLDSWWVPENSQKKTKTPKSKICREDANRRSQSSRRGRAIRARKVGTGGEIRRRLVLDQPSGRSGLSRSAASGPMPGEKGKGDTPSLARILGNVANSAPERQKVIIKKRGTQGQGGKTKRA